MFKISKTVSTMLIVLSTLTLLAASADARSLGGGKSFGRQSNNFSQRQNTPPQSAPAPPRTAPAAAPAQQPAAAP
ncbi:MAG TPA: hypothetical protein VLC91_16010, partial [Spongiibacteraceae bacterium]|nr:hypothetical protein [Spongiibacteraceae bacterium]